MSDVTGRRQHEDGYARLMTRLTAMLLLIGLVAVGCGWSPPAGQQPGPDTCTEADGPAAATVQQAIAGLPAVSPGNQWKETQRGHARNCRLYWVQVSVTGASASSPQQVLFFDRNTPLGTPTPEPRPYINVTTSGDDTVTIQYQWIQGSEPNCCPTGIGTARFQLGSDGKLSALDPIPGP